MIKITIQIDDDVECMVINKQGYNLDEVCALFACALKGAGFSWQGELFAEE